MTSALSFALFLAVSAGSVVAAGDAIDLEGRWEGRVALDRGTADERKRYCDGCAAVIDIVRCGRSWCGTEVAATGVCGAPALRIGAETETFETFHAFESELKLAAWEKFHAVLALVSTEAGRPPTLTLSGNLGPAPVYVMRQFPYTVTLSLRRTGGALCTTVVAPS